MMQCSLDGLPMMLCESPITYTHLETGHHKFEVEPVVQFDSGRLPTLWEWEVSLPLDTTPPETQIVKGPPAITGNAVVELEFTGIDDQTLDIDLEFECLLDGILVGSCSSILTTPTLPGVPYEIEVEEGAYGKHTVAVRAIDEMGNVDPTPATRTYTYVDVNSPDTSIDIGPEEETEGTIAYFEFSGEDINGMILFDFECSLDGDDFLPCYLAAHGRGPDRRPAQLPGARGEPVRRRRLDSGARRVADHPADRHRSAGHVHRGARRPGTSPARTCILGLASNELVEEFECSVDNEQFSGCDAVLELTGLLPGTHTVEARAMRYLTEVVDPTPARYTWTVVGEPETTIVTGPVRDQRQRQRDLHLRAPTRRTSSSCAPSTAPSRSSAPRRSSPARSSRTGTRSRSTR